MALSEPSSRSKLFVCISGLNLYSEDIKYITHAKIGGVFIELAEPNKTKGFKLFLSSIGIVSIYWRSESVPLVRIG